MVIILEHSIKNPVKTLLCEVLGKELPEETTPFYCGVMASVGVSVWGGEERTQPGYLLLCRLRGFTQPISGGPVLGCLSSRHHSQDQVC